MTKILRRLFVAVSFIALSDFCLLRWVISIGWLALVSGFLGSMLLIVPPLRIEYWKANRAKVDNIHPNPAGDIPEAQSRVKSLLSRKIEEWDEWDTLFMMLGGILLASHFLFQGAWEKNVAERYEFPKMTQGVHKEGGQINKHIK